MCQIIYKPAGKKFNWEYMNKAQKHNKDGYGVMWYEDGVAKSYTTMSFKTFKKVLSAIEGMTCVAHLRYSTVGKTTIDNCHPFEIPTGYMMHNGTIFSLKGSYASAEAASDSYKLSELLMNCDYEKVSDLKPLIQHIIGSSINRLVFLEDSGEVTIFNENLGVWDNGVWYSNDYHLKSESWCRSGCGTSYKKETPSKAKGATGAVKAVASSTC